MLVSVLLKELTEAYMVIEMLLAQQSRVKRKDRHKLKHDNLTVPTQLVPAGALWCHLQQYCHWGISLPRKMRSNQSKRNGSSSLSTIPVADDNLTVGCACVCTKPPPGSVQKQARQGSCVQRGCAQGAGRAGWLSPAVAGYAGTVCGVAVSRLLALLWGADCCHSCDEASELLGLE